jgi:enoyl-CoA hydratase
MAEPQLLVDSQPPVLVLTLHRPAALNALSNDLLGEVVVALEQADRDEAIRVAVVTGGTQVFAAGADLRQLSEAPVGSAFFTTRFDLWDRLKRIQKPLIAAVSGYALGAGCELAMHCDLIIASESARFGQPEINVGIMPGAGGTQRLTRAVGKARAMEMVLTGRAMTAHEAERSGLVNRVVPEEVLLDEAITLANDIAARPPRSIRLAKQSVLAAFDTGLEDGLDRERSYFQDVLRTEDAREGMTAFLEKRKPDYHGR